MNATLPRPLQLLIDFGTWLITVAITLIGLAALTFFIGRVLPIDPVLSIVGEKATPEVYQRVYLELGLDKPLWQQFWEYVQKILRGDFGVSFSTSRPVLTDLLAFFPATLELATIGLIIGADLGPNLTPIGSVATLLWFVLLRQLGHEVSTWSYVRVGLLVSPVTMAGATGVAPLLFLAGRGR